MHALEDKVLHYLNLFLNWLSDTLDVKTFGKKTTVFLTEFINKSVTKLINEDVHIDRKLREHVLYVFNNILIKLQDMELSHREARQSGKMLLRLYRVYKAYKEKRSEKSLSEVSDLLEKFYNKL